MAFISRSVINEILSAQDRCDDVVMHIEQANRMLDKFDFSRIIVLPCHFGSRLWWCYDDVDDGNMPIIEPSEPVKGFLVKPNGECLVTFDYECFDPVGGPDLFLLESEAQAEAARRIKKMQDKEDK